MNKLFTLLILLFTLVVKGFSQTTLSVGDISIIGFNANAPDNFAFVSWVALQNDTYIKFTDNAFLSTGSANATNNGRGGESFVIWRNNTGVTIAAGTVIKIEALTTTLGVATGGSTAGMDALSSSGDQIFAYQGSATSGTSPDWSTNTNPTTFNGTILYGLTFQGSGSATTWISTGTPSSNTSYRPSELNVTNGNIPLASLASRGEYTGSRSNQSTLSSYKALVNNAANWTTASGAGILSLNTTNFTTSVLPLSLLSFNAKAQGNNIIVDWKSNNEINHKYYEVVYSTDGSNFIQAGQRNALVGSGEKVYTLTHQNASLLGSKLFYRLKMVSTTGVVTYSNIVIVRFGKQVQGITDVYPNPTTGIVTLITNATEQVQLNLIDASGKIIVSKQVFINNTYNLDLTKYANGIYILEATLTNGNKQQFKVVKK